VNACECQCDNQPRFRFWNSRQFEANVQNIRIHHAHAHAGAGTGSASNSRTHRVTDVRHRAVVACPPALPADPGEPERTRAEPELLGGPGAAARREGGGKDNDHDHESSNLRDAATTCFPYAHRRC
jgi:hypothetical protein